jgi:fibronectin-binding autotransporter adhesin
MLIIVGAAILAAAGFAAAGGAKTAAGTPPSNTAAPVISGSAEQGKTLSASSGSWSGTTPMTYTYQWQRCDNAGANCGNITGGTAQTYTVALADVSHKLVVVVSAHNSAGKGSKPSAASAVVTGATPPSNTVQPTITGSAAVGWTLNASNGTWSGTAPITYTYIWRRCAANGATCTTISGATTKTYTLTNTDAGHTIRVAVTATNVGGSGEATSNATNTVAVTAPGNTTAPAITGTPTQGQTLTVAAGEWIGATPITYTYAWQRCDSSGNNCVAIAGATRTTFVLVAADAGHDVRATVTASNSAGKTSANSNTVGPVGSTTPPPPSGTTKLPNGETSIQASSVPDTDRLTVSSVKFSPSAITGRAPVTVTFKVIENNKYDVSGALVYVLGLPYSWAKASPEAATAADGTVTLTITPTAKAPKRGALVLFVRARTPSGSLLAGSSTRRLVQVLMRP